MIIVPTRELAVQTYNLAQILCNFGKPNKKGNCMNVMKLVGHGENPTFSRRRPELQFDKKGKPQYVLTAYFYSLQHTTSALLSVTL